MRVLHRLCGTLLVGAAAGSAMADNAATLEACVTDAFTTEFSSAHAEAACVGTLSDGCVAALPGGGTTIGIMECIAGEQRAWDGLLNNWWKELRAGPPPGPDDPLLAAQRAWLAFREADCTAATAQFEGGTIAGIVANGCMRDMTARRAIELYSRLNAGF